jgi:hypothetical protein
MLKLKKLLLTTLLSTATLFAGFTNVDCTNQTHLDTLKLPHVECEILDAFWTAMGDGADWTDKTGWDTVTYADTWSGVYMHDDNSSIRAFGWGLVGNNLTGEIPESITDFIALEVLGLPNNNLYGSLPELSLSSSLYFLNFTNNQFTGNIPSSYANLTKLTGLYLANNQLSGPLPNLSQLAVLEFFYIEDNNFTFSDIEPQIDNIKDIDKPRYAPQAPIDESTHPIVYFDETLSIIPSLPSNPSGHDYYTWKKDGVVLEDNRVYVDGNYSASRIYVKIGASEADSGAYSYEVNNSKVTLPNGSGISRDLVLQSSTTIQAVYENAPTILNQNPQTTGYENQTYTYTSNISDADNDDLTVTTLALPSWLSLTANTDSFTLSGTPSYTDAGTYDINITVTDGKIPVHKNYVLTIEQNIPTGYTAGDNSYTHDATGTSIAIGSPYYYSFPEVDDTDNIELYSRSNAWRNVYEGLTPEGILTTGYFNNDKGTSKTPTLSTSYPLGSKATLLEEPNSANHQPMIMIEVKLTDTTPSVTIGE